MKVFIPGLLRSWAGEEAGKETLLSPSARLLPKSQAARRERTGHPLRTTNTSSLSRCPVPGSFQFRAPAAALKEADPSRSLPPRASRRFPSFSDPFMASRGLPARRRRRLPRGVATPPHHSLLSRGRPESHTSRSLPLSLLSLSPPSRCCHSGGTEDPDQ